MLCEEKQGAGKSFTEMQTMIGVAYDFLLDLAYRECTSIENSTFWPEQRLKAIDDAIARWSAPAFKKCYPELSAWVVQQFQAIPRTTEDIQARLLLVNQAMARGEAEQRARDRDRAEQERAKRQSVA